MHRNLANIVVYTDLNCLSVLQFAVDVLKVRHVIVTGHYGCGGVRAALENSRLGLSDNWLRHVQDVRERHEGILAALTDGSAKMNRLCELNVVEQVRHVCETTIVQDAWDRKQTARDPWPGLRSRRRQAPRSRHLGRGGGRGRIGLCGGSRRPGEGPPCAEGRPRPLMCRLSLVVS